MPTPHKHAEVIHAYADGAKVDVKLPEGTHWKPCAYPDFDPNLEYRIRIEPAAPKWPQTTMALDELSIHHQNDPTPMDLRKFANQIISHECEMGNVIPAATVREIEAKARAEAGILVAREIQKSVRILGHHSDSELLALPI
jgi:hypothetical protein